MAANGISTLATKELRQLAKLGLAQTSRQTPGTPFRTYNVFDIMLLPTRYVGDTVVDNPGPLLAARPWTIV